MTKDNNIAYWVEIGYKKRGKWLNEKERLEFKRYKEAKYLYDSLKPYNSTITLIRVSESEDDIPDEVIYEKEYYNV